jgi:arylsulfatase A-like enzyme
MLRHVRTSSLRRGAAWLAVLGACLPLSSCSKDSGPQPPQRPHILLISLDSTRRDRLGCYGNAPKHAGGQSPTPHLDALAARGVRFEDALSATSWTLPSHISLFTGQSLHAHAVEMDHLRMCASSPVLAEILARENYRTAGFASGPYLDPLWGFGRGFERYEICYGDALADAAAKERAARQAWESADKSLPDPQRAALFATWRELHKLVESLSHQDVSSAIVTERALAEIRGAKAGGKPLFLFAHYFDPHYDYVPPAPYDTRFDPDYTGALDGKEFFTNPAVSTTIRALPGARERKLSDRDLEHVLALYDGEVAWVDFQIGRLLQELEVQGLADDTLVIVTADHGDEFFEHGGLGHRRTLYEEVQRVPLIVAWPRVLQHRSGVHGHVGGQDVLPTVLELLDLRTPGGITGSSFADLLRGAGRAEERQASTRLVVLDSGEVALDKAKPSETVPAQVVRVIEAYYHGPLKLMRQRVWIESPFAVGPVKRAAFDQLKRTQFERESLEWIDLAAHPDEPDAAWSTDFSDARARAALEAWRKTYAVEAALRCNPSKAEKDTGTTGALGALGYTDSGGASDVDTSVFELPPPGELLPR